MGKISLRDRKIRKVGWPKQESLGKSKGLALFYK